MRFQHSIFLNAYRSWRSTVTSQPEKCVGGVNARKLEGLLGTTVINVSANQGCASILVSRNTTSIIEFNLIFFGFFCLLKYMFILVQFYFFFFLFIFFCYTIQCRRNSRVFLAGYFNALKMV